MTKPSECDTQTFKDGVDGDGGIGVWIPSCGSPT